MWFNLVKSDWFTLSGIISIINASFVHLEDMNRPVKSLQRRFVNRCSLSCCVTVTFLLMRVARSADVSSSPMEGRGCVSLNQDCGPQTQSWRGFGAVPVHLLVSLCIRHRDGVLFIRRIRWNQAVRERRLILRRVQRFLLPLRTDEPGFKVPATVIIIIACDIKPELWNFTSKGITKTGLTEPHSASWKRRSNGGASWASVWSTGSPGGFTLRERSRAVCDVVSQSEAVQHANNNNNVSILIW